MRGPWWEGSKTADYKVWYCSQCGHRCERFAFELPQEEVNDSVADAVRLARG